MNKIKTRIAAGAALVLAASLALSGCSSEIAPEYDKTARYEEQERLENVALQEAMDAAADRIWSLGTFGPVSGYGSEQFVLEDEYYTTVPTSKGSIDVYAKTAKFTAGSWAAGGINLTETFDASDCTTFTITAKTNSTGFSTGTDTVALIFVDANNKWVAYTGWTTSEFTDFFNGLTTTYKTYTGQINSDTLSEYGVDGCLAGIGSPTPSLANFDASKVKYVCFFQRGGTGTVYIQDITFD